MMKNMFLMTVKLEYFFVFFEIFKANDTLSDGVFEKHLTEWNNV